jgi:flagellin-like protein
MYIGAKIRFSNFVDNLKKDETGVSSIVATVLLILIVVLLAAVFWDNISQWFTDTWDKITGQADTIHY